jgi:predicted RNA-binding protein with PUA-like domain
VAKWLMKSEPDVFGFDDLVRVKREGWDGVRNYQARNYMRSMVKGDEVIFYHSNAKPPGVAGIAKVVKTAEPDPTQFDPSSKYHDPDSDPADPRWDWVTVAPVRRLDRRPAGDARTRRVPPAREGESAVGDAALRRRVRGDRGRRRLPAMTAAT